MRSCFCHNHWGLWRFADFTQRREMILNHIPRYYHYHHIISYIYNIIYIYNNRICIIYIYYNIYIYIYSCFIKDRIPAILAEIFHILLLVAPKKNAGKNAHGCAQKDISKSWQRPRVPWPRHPPSSSDWPHRGGWVIRGWWSYPIGSM